MDKIIDYCLVSDTGYRIGGAISLKIQKGWQPFGNAYMDTAILEEHEAPLHFQPMVKYED